MSRNHGFVGDRLPRTVYAETVAVGGHAYRFAVKENLRRQRRLYITSTSGRGKTTRLVVPESHLQAFYEAYYRSTQQFDPRPKAYRLDELRERSPNAFRKWTPDDDDLLARKFLAGTGVQELTEILGRQTGAVLFRLLNLGLILS